MHIPLTGPTSVRPEDRHILACTLWAEARGEGAGGMAAVAWVIVNRWRNPGWWSRQRDDIPDDTIAAVCLDRWQFSCWFDQQAARLKAFSPGAAELKAAREVTDDVLNGIRSDPTGGADHYYATYILAPAWARGRTPTAEIGRHRFYRIGQKG